MTSRPRNANGTFKSSFDDDQAKFHADIKSKMDAGMSFDEAWIAAGGDIVPTTLSDDQSVKEMASAYAAAGRQPMRIRPK